MKELPSPHLGHVQRSLLEWYARHGRDLPWRRTRDPYAVLVSEMMLQQTRVERVLPRWRAWLDRFPTLQALAQAPRGDVIRAWSGLGYNLRAIRLHQIARQVVDQCGGRMPDTLQGLLRLTGIGRYTAGAVASFAYGLPVAMVDTNIRRVLGRVYLGQPHTGPEQDQVLLALAEAALPADCAYEWNQALMDLGATICTVQRPACLTCPLRDPCRAAPLMAGWVEERKLLLRERRAVYGVDVAAARQSDADQRFYRGRIVEQACSLGPAELLDRDELGRSLRPDYGAELRPWLEATLRKLASDGLLYLEERGGSLSVGLPR